MKTVAIISQKGGSGKSTLALHLAVASSRERDTAVIDLDPQASAASWADRREAGTPPVLSAHSSRLPFVMKKVEQAEGPQGSLVILDTAPHADRVALDAAKAADLVLIPARATIFDIEPCLAVLLTWGSDTPVATGQSGMVRPVKTACLTRGASAVRPA